jgi:hypothetical protein
VPVTVTVKLPAVDPVHDRVEVPDVVVVLRVMLVGLRVHVRPVEAVWDSETTPEKPLVAATVIVEVPDEPTPTLTLVGFAVAVKFGAGPTVYVTVAE